jgi:hypothetical protein
MKFALGNVVATNGAIHALNQIQVMPLELLNRHVNGDYGTVCKEDVQANEDALKHGDRILSAYTYRGYDFFVITEHDRSSTCVMLKSDY